MATEASERCTYTQAKTDVRSPYVDSTERVSTVGEGKSTDDTPPHLRTQSGGYGANDEEDGLSELDADSKEAPNAAALYAFETLVRSSQRVGETLLETWRSELETLMIFAALLSLAISAFARDFHANPFWAPSFVLSFTTALFALSVRQWLGAVPDLRCPPARTAAIVRQMPNVVCALVGLLRAAVVLFLVGLLVLLHEFRPTTSVKLIVAGAAAFLLYSFVAQVPSQLWPTCFRTRLRA